MLASSQHVSLDFPAAFPIGDALPGRGVGGLLAVTHTGDGTWFLAYDGNGNVTGYVEESGSSAAAYRYDPYGLLVSATGPEKDRFRHRFSTKPQDWETGLLCYGYRYLETTTGRWINRDPIEEEGEINLYAFVGNDGVNGWDFLGLSGFLPPSGGSRAYFPPSPRSPQPGIEAYVICPREFSLQWTRERVTGVSAVYDKEIGEITIVSNVTGREVVVPSRTGGCFDESGEFSEDESGIPSGRYWIVTHDKTRHFGRDRWFSLYADDHKIDDISGLSSVWNRRMTGHGLGVGGRGRFRFHLGRESLGCITAWEGHRSVTDAYNDAVDLIMESGSYFIFSEPRSGARIRVYGLLQVR